MLLSLDVRMDKKDMGATQRAMLLTPYYRMDKKDVGATKRCTVVDTRQQNGQERFGGYQKVQCYCHQMLEWTRKTWALLKRTVLLTPYHRIDKKDVGATKRCNVIDIMLQRGQDMGTTKIWRVIVMR